MSLGIGIDIGASSVTVAGIRMRSGSLSLEYYRHHLLEELVDQPATPADIALAVSARLAQAGIKHTVHQLPATVGDKGDVTTLYNLLGGDDEEFRRVIQTLPEMQALPETEAPPAQASASPSPTTKRLTSTKSVRARMTRSWPFRGIKWPTDRIVGP